jgi:hypothetical protein
MSKLNLHALPLCVLASGLTCGGAAAADPPPKALSTAGWQKVAARKGGCFMSVPQDWKVSPILKGAAESDDHASAVVSLADSTTTLAEVKPVIQGMYKPTKTFEDGAQRLWYAYEINGRTGWYVGVPVKGGICGAQITFKPGSEALATQIAKSVGAGS